MQKVLVRVQMIVTGLVNNPNQVVLFSERVVYCPIQLSQLEGRRVVVVSDADDEACGPWSRSDSFALQFVAP